MFSPSLRSECVSGFATPPAPSPNHGGERLFQGVSASKTAARVISFLAASALALLLLASPGRASPQFIVALGGYDAVAYQTPGEAVQGAATNTRSSGTAPPGSSAARPIATPSPRTPGRFAPRFDGYCAYAASQGYKAPGSPLAWRVVDGKLYVNFSQRPGVVAGRCCRAHRRRRPKLAETQCQLRSGDRNDGAFHANHAERPAVSRRCALCSAGRLRSVSRGSERSGRRTRAQT